MNFEFLGENFDVRHADQASMLYIFARSALPDNYSEKIHSKINESLQSISNDVSDGMSPLMAKSLQMTGDLAHNIQIHDLPDSAQELIQDLQESDISDLEKLSAINNYLQGSMTYDDSEIAGVNQLDALRNGRGDCDDFAKLTLGMGVLAGIDESKLALVIGAVSIDLEDAVSSGGPHGSILYQDEIGQTYFIDMNLRDPALITGPGFEADLSENKIWGGTPDGNYINISEGDVSFNMAIDGVYTQGNVLEVYDKAVPDYEPAPPPRCRETTGHPSTRRMTTAACNR